MTTLDDSFTTDLGNLSDDSLDDRLSEQGFDGDIEEADLNSDELDTMKKVEIALTNDDHDAEDNDELIVKCNTLSAKIDDKLAFLRKFIRDRYHLKFPELESWVHHPVDYARVVKKIGNETDLTLVDLQGLLPSAIIMVVSTAASTTNGKPLPDQALQKTIEACDRALALDAAKEKVLEFFETRMAHIAPNLSALTGSAVAAKFMGVGGGLKSLVDHPDIFKSLGAKWKPLAGFSTTSRMTGYLAQTDIYQSTPPADREHVYKLLASKSSLAARFDYARTDPSGEYGRGLRDEILKKMDTWQEPAPARQPKPLPVPDPAPKKKRGGARMRKMKERYGMTEMRKQANRMAFGVAEESSFGGGYGYGFGMLGQDGCGKMRVVAEPSKLGARAAKKLKCVGGGAASGLASSFAFTPAQGIELINPRVLANDQPDCGTQSTYFPETFTFSKRSY